MPRSAGAGDARTCRWLRGSDRFQPDPGQGDGLDRRWQLRRPLHPLWHPRARDGRRRDWHGAARRRHTLYRHVPRLHRLPAAGPANGRDYAPAGHLHPDAQLDRPRGGWPNRISRSSNWQACARCPTFMSTGRPTRWKRRNVGNWRCAAPTGRACWPVTAGAAGLADRHHRKPLALAADMCWPRPTVRVRRPLSPPDRKCRSPWPRGRSLARDGIAVAWSRCRAGKCSRSRTSLPCSGARRCAPHRHRSGRQLRLGTVAGTRRHLHRNDRIWCIG